MRDVRGKGITEKREKVSELSTGIRIIDKGIRKAEKVK